jgi:diadenosine tetraphosphate (Ap4A) HIT family hydrolase
MSCLFCDPDSSRIFYEEDAAYYCYWDAFPVAPGHALVIPRRHIATWFEATKKEQEFLLRGIEVAKQEIEKQYKPDANKR